VDFTHYKDRAAAVAADLVNTLGSPSGTEFLPDPDALASFLAEHDIEANGPVTKRHLEEIRSLRARLREVFLAPDDTTTARLLNDLLAETGVLPQITDHDGSNPHLHYVPADNSPVGQLTAVCAMGLATVVCELGRQRLGVCSADRCGDVFVDLSRNRSRRFCNETCSSRTNVAAYRARLRD
jgi:predicted RNA-binding Zn ribbon-like protein